MLTSMQKTSIKLLADNDPELALFLASVSRFVTSPRIISYCLANRITGKTLKQIAIKEYAGDPELFVKGFNKRMNQKVTLF